MRFAHQHVVITGSASGIGAATAERFAAEGAIVHGLDLAHGVDVSDETAVAQALAPLERIDVLFANAGIPHRQTTEHVALDDWERIYAVHVRGTFLCAKHAIPKMPAGASIVLTSSIAGITGMRNRPAYGSAKAALAHLAKNLALDLAPRGIRVNCVAPGFADTPLLDGLRRDPARFEAIRALHPLGRLATAHDIAAAVLFLSSSDASFITGVVLPVDGGFSAGRPEDV